MSIPTLREVSKRIDQIAGDERYHYPDADITINAPLALIQVSMKAEIYALCWVLGREIPKRRCDKGSKGKKAARRGEEGGR